MQDFDVIPLGGLGEVGMNNMLFRTEEHSFLLDCGTASSHSPWLGFDSVFPAYEKVFGSKLKWPDEVLITHGHEDHIGGLPHYIRRHPNKVKIHASPFTSELIKKKIGENSLDSSCEIIVHKQAEVFHLGPWKVQYFFNNHSIYDSNCLLLENGGFRIFHTGDFRIDHETYHDPIFDFKKMNLPSIDLFLSDSTNAERPGKSLGEAAIGDNFNKIIQQSSGAVVFTCFASNVRRLQHIVEAGKKNQRKFCFVGRSMEKFIDLAQRYDVFQIPSEEKIALERIHEVPREKLVLLLTGSQGEFQAALSRMLHDQMRNFGLVSGDALVYSALQIPGNESRIRYLLNKCVEKDVKIYKNSGEFLVHTTGHAYSEELKESLLEVNPKYFLPVHGDLSMLRAHKQIADDTLVNTKSFCIKNYQGIHFSKQEEAYTFSIADELPLNWSRYEYSGSVEDQSIKQKKKIAREGLVNLIYSEKTLFDGNLQLRICCFGCQYLEEDWSEAKWREDLLKDFYKDYDAGNFNIDSWMRQWLRSKIRKRYAMRPLIEITKI